ncbi:hypothetical protein VIGAN_01102200 [Vigna angularis var. angularis]|uniref:Knottin scorpion toxin-like domain-containing protein n=1 Tax=Vigna angularis var. angularis TaxID=157739 RepID=A0A0S3QYV3_PHAAN|nr:hypothetical protein VIGAN_01102200 [Vigna angularis var. angularis]
MFYKMVILVLLMRLVVMDAETCSEGGGKNVDKERVSPSTCLEKCMPICMKIRAATFSQCNPGCRLGCKQLQGQGSIFFRPMT